MQLRSGELDAQLKKALLPAYAIHGDEPLLAMEAADAVRGAARRAGFTEREVLAKEAEEQLLYRDMQSDMVSQIMRRLSVAQKPRPRD